MLCHLISSVILCGIIAFLRAKVWEHLRAARIAHPGLAHQGGPGALRGLQDRAWLAALKMAINRQFPEDVRGKGLNLMSGTGCQPRSVSFMKACRSMGVNQAFTSGSNPKGNADTERFMRTLRGELVWINGSPAQARSRRLWVAGLTATAPTPGTRLQAAGGLRGRIL